MSDEKRAGGSFVVALDADKRAAPCFSASEGCGIPDAGGALESAAHQASPACEGRVD
jgi:hypothetical protein